MKKKPKFNMTAIPISHRRALKCGGLWAKLMPDSDPPLMGDLIRFVELAGIGHLKRIINQLSKSDYKRGASDEMLHARCGQIAATIAANRAKNRR